jgi:alkanesulfonate monooxygenase SsuD/methylene tetrahydromethanopterin reductase-like flavin-dependent oxidoreductase (luciferase family)
MKKLWTEDDVTFEGRFFHVEGMTLGPKPARKPHPDVWFGGYSPAALSRVARIGEGWLPSFVAPDEYGTLASTIRAIAQQHDRTVDPEHFGALVAYVPAGGDPAAFYDAIARRRPGVDPRALIAADGGAALRGMLARFIDQGASKFVVVPAASPRDWAAELASLRDAILSPLMT